MKLLGIDPGIARTGWAVIDCEGQTCRPVDFGCIATEKNLTEPQRLSNLYDEIVKIIKRFRPHAVAIEELFFNTNAKTAIAVGQARGVIILASVKQNLAVYGYTPLEVKMAITGYGRADKNQIQQMVKTILKLENPPKPDDVADALSVALTHAYTKNWKI